MAATSSIKSNLVPAKPAEYIHASPVGSSDSFAVRVFKPAAKSGGSGVGMLSKTAEAEAIEDAKAVSFVCVCVWYSANVG